MVMTPERMRELESEKVFRVALQAPVPTPVPVPPTPARRPTHLAGRWAAIVGAAWFAGFQLILAVEPAPADPNAPEPIWATVLGAGFLIVMMAMVAGLFQRRRGALVASAIGVAAVSVMVITCPVSAHHVGIGGWWFGQVATVAAIAGVTAAAAKRG